MNERGMCEWNAGSEGPDLSKLELVQFTRSPSEEEILRPHMPSPKLSLWMTALDRHEHVIQSGERAVAKGHWTPWEIS